MKLTTPLITLVLSSLLFAPVGAEEDRSEVLKRIKPVGTVAITGQEPPAAAKPAAAAPEAKAAPAAATTVAVPTTAAIDAAGIYSKTCIACHATGAAGAPKLDDKANWAPRIEKGVEALYASAFNGTSKGMPPRGTCMQCSDGELKAVVDYMVSQAK